MRTVRSCVLTAAVLTCLGWSSLGVSAPKPVRDQRQTSGGDAASAGGAVAGSAWKADNTPLPEAKVRLRNVRTGRIAATAVADENGQFRFDAVEPGAYVVELVTDTGRVVSVSQLFSISAGETVATFVRVGTKAPWFTGFFSNAAAAAIATASGLGVTAVGSNGLPASPQ